MFNAEWPWPVYHGPNFGPYMVPTTLPYVPPTTLPFPAHPPCQPTILPATDMANLDYLDLSEYVQPPALGETYPLDDLLAVEHADAPEPLSAALRDHVAFKAKPSCRRCHGRGLLVQAPVDGPEREVACPCATR